MRVGERPGCGPKAGITSSPHWEFAMYKPCILAGVLLLSAASSAFAQTAAGPTPVSLVLVLDGGPSAAANLPKLLDVVRHGTALSKKDGAMAGKARLLRSVVGGDSARILLVVEFPTLVAYATTEAAHAQSADWQKLNTELAASGFRLVSTALDAEVKF
jgi:hypothetical protein